jgi:hypothetical protein
MTRKKSSKDVHYAVYLKFVPIFDFWHFLITNGPREYPLTNGTSSQKRLLSL